MRRDKTLNTQRPRARGFRQPSGSTMHSERRDETAAASAAAVAQLSLNSAAQRIFPTFLACAGTVNAPAASKSAGLMWIKLPSARVKSTCRHLSIIRQAQSRDRNRDQGRHVDMLTPVDNSSSDRRPTASEPTRPAPRLACCSQVEMVGTVSGSGTGVAMVRSCHARHATHPF